MAPQAGAPGKETAIMNMAHCFVNIKRALECPEPATEGSSHNSLARTDHLAGPAAKVPAKALGLVQRRQRWKPQGNSTNGSQQSTRGKLAEKHGELHLGGFTPNSRQDRGQTHQLFFSIPMGFSSR